MLRRMSSVAAVVLLLLLALGGGPLEAQPEAEQPSDGTVEPAPQAGDAAPADSTGGGVEGEPDRPEGEGEATEEGAEAADRDEVRQEAAESEVVAPSGLRVLRAYICKGIEQSEPTEAGKSFIPAADGVLRLCCFSEIGGADRPDTVSHVWYWGDREMARVPLVVEGSRWRTWSTKRIVDEWRGDWRVDIVDPDGFVLKRLSFSIE